MKKFLKIIMIIYNFSLAIIAIFNLLNFSLDAWRLLLALEAIQVGLYKIDDLFNY